MSLFLCAATLPGTFNHKHIQNGILIQSFKLKLLRETHQLSPTTLDDLKLSARTQILSIKKTLDEHSPKLFELCTHRNSIAQLSLVSLHSTEKERPFFKMAFDQCYFFDYELSSQDETLCEYLSLIFHSASYTSTPFDSEQKQNQQYTGRFSGQN